MANSALTSSLANNLFSKPLIVSTPSAAINDYNKITNSVAKTSADIQNQLGKGGSGLLNGVVAGANPPGNNAKTAVLGGAQSSSPTTTPASTGSSAYQAAVAGGQYVQMVSPSGQTMPVLKSQEQVMLNSGFKYPGTVSNVQSMPVQNLQPNQGQQYQLQADQTQPNPNQQASTDVSNTQNQTNNYPSFQDYLNQSQANNPSQTINTQPDLTQANEIQARMDANQQQYQQQITQVNQQIDQTYAGLLDSITKLQNGTFPLNPDQQAQVKGLQDSFERLKQQQMIANANYQAGITQAGIASGRNRYAPEIEMGNIANAVNVGIQKMADLDSQAAQQVATLRQSMEEKNYSLVKDQYTQLQDILKQKADTLNKVYDKTMSYEKDLRDTNLKLAQDSVDNQLKSAQLDMTQKKQVFDQAMASAQFDQSQRKAIQDEFYRQQDLEFRQNQADLANELAFGKFSYQQKQDAIQNALANKKITIDQANELRDYDLKVKQLEQGDYVVTQDAFGNPVAFNKRTGQFEQSALPSLNNGMNQFNLGTTEGVFMDALLNTLPTSGLTKDQKATAISQIQSQLKAGDTQRARETLIRTVTKNATAEDQKNAMARLQAIGALNDVQSALNTYVKKSGDTSIWSGGLETAMQKIGKSSDPQLAYIQNQIQQSIQKYRQAISGAAFTPSESKEYANLFPNINNNDSLNTVKIKSLLDSFNRQQKIFLSSSIGDKNYDDLFGSVQNPTAPLTKRYSDLNTLVKENPDYLSVIDKIEKANPNISDQDLLEYLNSKSGGGNVNENNGNGEIGGNRIYGGGGGGSFNSPLSMGLNGSNSVLAGAQLGALSKKYESGGNPGAIGYDSTGGYSYGTYQLAHNSAEQFINQSPFKQAFTGLTFNSPQWRQRWQEVAQQYPDQFTQAQEQYAVNNWYEPLAQKAEQLGVNLDNYSPVLKDVIFSTAIQHGAGTDVVNKALAKVGKNASEADLIKAIYAERWANGTRFANSTPAVKQAVYNRFFGQNGELNTALNQLQSLT